MTSSTWQERRLPDTSASTRACWRWQPTTLAQLTAARRALRGDLADQATCPPGTGEADVDHLLLAFEELVSNALRHGGPPVSVQVVATGHGWLVDVADGRPDVTPAPPVGRDPALGGLGLDLIARLASSHGWVVEGTAKHVWACLTPRGG
jgi:anti-sigma regulatory factor (Ser/Thr protein kinase)